MQIHYCSIKVPKKTEKSGTAEESADSKTDEDTDTKISNKIRRRREDPAPVKKPVSTKGKPPTGVTEASSDATPSIGLTTVNVSQIHKQDIVVSEYQLFCNK